MKGLCHPGKQTRSQKLFPFVKKVGNRFFLLAAKNEEVTKHFNIRAIKNLQTVKVLQRLVLVSTVPLCTKMFVCHGLYSNVLKYCHT